MCRFWRQTPGFEKGTLGVKGDVTVFGRIWQEAPPLPMNEKVDRTTRNRIEDTSSKAVWRLETDTKPNGHEAERWLEKRHATRWRPSLFGGHRY